MSANPPKSDALAIPKAEADVRIYTPAQMRQLFTNRMDMLTKLFPEKQKAAAARLAQAVITEFAKNENLWKCTGLSLYACAVQAATLNLEIGGVLGQAYMVPYNNRTLPEGVKEAQFQLGYKGLIVLAHRSGQLRGSPRAVSVRTGETLTVVQGSDPRLEHIPGDAPVDPSGKDITHVYATIQYRNGGKDFEVMSRDQVEKHRNKYSKMPNSPAWRDAWEAMAWKTVIRKLLKRAPLSVELPPDVDFGEAVGEELQIDEPRSATAAAQPEESKSDKPPVIPSLDSIVALIDQVAKAEGTEADSIITDICDTFKVNVLDDLSDEERVKVHAELQQQLKSAASQS